MALARDPPCSAPFLLSLLLFVAVHSVDSLKRHPPMVLLLFLSPSNATLRSVEAYHFRHRHLQKDEDSTTSEARMRLYDDLLTNGYYTTRLYIGTPPQEFVLIVDSGSTVTYVPCGNYQVVEAVVGVGRGGEKMSFIL